MTGVVPYWHVDAFATRSFEGNQAAVMLLDGWPEDAVLRAIGEENSFAETAFLVPIARDARAGAAAADQGGADFALRWFTPTAEVRLCGHATLAAGHVVLAGDAQRAAVRFATRQAGVLEVRRAQGGYDLALGAIAVEPGAPDGAAAALGGAPRETFLSPLGYAVFVFATPAEVIALAPDFRALAALGGWTMIATARGGEADIVSRVFVPAFGIDEDSVTGAAHAVLAPFWAPRLGSDAFAAHQASARGGRIACRLEGSRVWLGGACVTVVEGRFFL